MLWNYSYHGTDFCPHHNIDYYYPEKAPTSFPNVFAAVYKNEGSTVSDDIIEIQPTGPTSGEIIWRWNAWDHRTEGNGIGEPELLSLAAAGRMDWLHINSISFNPELNQLVLGTKN